MREGNYFLESITDFQTVTNNKIVQSNCMSITFINRSNSTVIINGLVLPPNLGRNETLEIRQPDGFIDRTQYDISFLSDGPTKDCSIIRILPKNQS